MSICTLTDIWRFCAGPSARQAVVILPERLVGRHLFSAPGFPNKGCV